ncbi:hypothetical protein [Streptomyces sp. C36]|uniref:hypothetical protein n=1 Tax=Streptomyces sp. C36 TaxID=3237122 RepID=UPI0034C68CF1
MPAQTGAEREPHGALRALRDAVAELREAAGNPSARALARKITDDAERLKTTASHNTVTEVFTGKRLTRLVTLQVVVLQLHKDRKQPSPGGGKSPSAEEIWPRFEALWHQAKQEKDHQQLPQALRTFTSLMRDMVFGPLGHDVDVISDRLGTRARPGPGVPAVRLTAICHGTHVPEKQEVDHLVDLLEDSGQGLAPGDRQALMVSYYDMLRVCAPDRYADYMVREECEAHREFRAALEDRVKALERRHRRDGEGAGDRDREPREQTSPARPPQIDARLLKDELDLTRRRIRALRADLARQSEHIRTLKGKLSDAEGETERARKDIAAAQNLVLDVRSQRDELERRNTEQAALLEVANTMAATAERVPPPAIPTVPMTGWDTTAWSQSQPWSHDYDPYAASSWGGAEGLLCNLPPEGSAPGPYALYSYNDRLYPPPSWTPEPFPGSTAAGGALAAMLSSQTTAPPFTPPATPLPPSDVTAAAEDDSAPDPADPPAPQTPTARTQGPFQLLRAVLRPGTGRHARRRRD